MKNDSKTMGRRLGRVSAGVGIGALSVMLAAGPAAAYRCSAVAIVNGDGTVSISGSGVVGGSPVNLTSTCFDPVTVPTDKTGAFSTKVTLNANATPGTTCSFAVDAGEECGTTFKIPTTPPPTTTPTTAPPVTQVGGNDQPGDEATTTTVQVLGNNTENEDPDGGNTSGPGASSESGKLPFTGMETAGLVTAGALMVAGGALLVSGVRRRQTA